MLRALRDILAIPEATALRLRARTNRGPVFAGDFGARDRPDVYGDGRHDQPRRPDRPPRDARPAAGHGGRPRALRRRSSRRVPSRPSRPRARRSRWSRTRSAPRRAPGRARAGASPLAGRDEELGVLLDALARARGGDGGLVEIVGEAGTGKSRLVAELLVGAGCRHAARRPLLHLGRRDAVRRRPRRVARARRDRPRRERGRRAAGERSRRGSPDLLPDAVPMAPAARDPVRRGGGGDPRWPTASPRRSVATGSTPGARAHPRRGAGRRLCSAPRGPPLGRRGEPRADRRHGRVAEGREPPRCSRSAALDAAPIAAEPLARIELGGPAAGGRRRPGHGRLRPARCRTRTSPAIVARAAGNPLFARELAEVAATTGSVDRLPERLESLVASRIDRLDPRGRRLLRRAAVLGRVVDVDLLADVVADDGDARDARDLGLWSDLDEFVSWEGPSVLRFRHDLVRDAAYEGLTPRPASRPAPRASRSAIERRAGEETDPVAAELAVHFARGPAARARLPLRPACRRPRPGPVRERRRGGALPAGDGARHAGSVTCRRRPWPMSPSRWATSRSSRAATTRRSRPTTQARKLHRLQGDTTDVAGHLDPYADADWAHQDGDAGFHLARLARKSGIVSERIGRYEAAIRVVRPRPPPHRAGHGGRGARADRGPAGDAPDDRRGRDPDAPGPLRGLRRAPRFPRCRPPQRAHRPPRPARQRLLPAARGVRRSRQPRGRAVPRPCPPDLRGAGRPRGPGERAQQPRHRGVLRGALGRRAGPVRGGAATAKARAGDIANAATQSNNEAEILSDQGRLAEAEALLRDALRVWSAAGYDDRRGPRDEQPRAGRGASRAPRRRRWICWSDAAALLRAHRRRRVRGRDPGARRRVPRARRALRRGPRGCLRDPPPGPARSRSRASWPPSWSGRSRGPRSSMACPARPQSTSRPACARRGPSAPRTRSRSRSSRRSRFRVAPTRTSPATTKRPRESSAAWASSRCPRCRASPGRPSPDRSASGQTAHEGRHGKRAGREHQDDHHRRERVEDCRHVEVGSARRR